MSDEATSKPGKTWIYVAGILASLPLLYALSVGPATALLMRSTSSRENSSLFASTYKPLFSFADVSGTDGIVRVYQDAWLRVAGIDPAAFH